ncbi:MAG: DUF1592 domain-containing protein [Deltaproteobacteria bacterium]|nr:MAG: DUF1592 domain-containing protein [Deltaproteobacteria bacterium]
MRWLILVAAGCGIDTGFDTPPSAASLPVRVQLVTDAQYRNAVHDLLGDVKVPALHSPGTTPDQFIHEDVLAVDAPLLVQYRIAAESIAAELAADPGRLGCDAADDRCLRIWIDRLAVRAFRRPIYASEHDQLAALYDAGVAGGGPGAGIGLVVEAVLQAPSFVYRTEIGPPPGAPPGTDVELTPYELASELGALLLDSIPDDALWAAARDGSLADRDVLAAQVDRLLGLPRVRDHLVDVVLDWLEVPAIFTAGKDAMKYPEMTPELRASMYGETRQFVAEVLWHRRGSLRVLLTSNESFIDARLAEIYGMRFITADELVPVILDPRRRGGILTQPSVLALAATPQSESIVRRGLFIERKLLCQPDLGRPPFSTIAAVASQVASLSEAQYSVYRTTTAYCAGCHGAIDPPGRTLHHFDGLGRWRNIDAVDDDIDATASLMLDDREREVDGALAMARALADSDQVAHCVVDQLAHYALGRTVDDPALSDYLYSSFDRSERDLVAVFRALATAPVFRMRREVP